MLSMHIIADHLKQFNPESYITTFASNVYTCRLFQNQKELRDKVVYVGNSDDIFQDGSDQVVLIHQDEWIRLDTLQKDVIMNAVIDLIEAFASWNQDMLELVASAAMIQDLVNRSCQIIKAPIFLVDASQRLLAISPNYSVGTVDDIYDEMLTHGVANMAFLSTVHEKITTADTDREMHYYNDPCLPHAIYQQGFYVQHQLVGEVCMIDLNGDITKGDLLTFQFMCRHLERWFQSNLQVHEEIQLQLYLNQAVSDPDFDQSELIWHLQLQGWKEDDPLMLVKLDAPYHPYNINDHLSRSLNSLFHIHATQVEYSICCLCNLNLTPLKKLTEDLIPFLHSGKYYGTYSPIFTFSDSFYESYHLVTAASDHCHKEIGNLYDGNNFIHYYIFEEISHHVPREQLHPALKILEDYDASHHADLYQTLKVYLEQERSPVATAKILQLHRNSLAYRLEKIKELIETDLDDPDIRLYLRISFMSSPAGI